LDTDPSCLNEGWQNELIQGDWCTQGPLRINEHLSLDALQASVLFTNARLILSKIEQLGGVELTGSGGIASPALNSINRLLWWGNDGEYRQEWSRNAEGEPRPVELLRRALELMGALVHHGTRLIVSPKGVVSQAPSEAGPLYADLLRTYFRRIDHSSIDGGPPIPLTWSHLGCALHAIGQTETSWCETTAFISKLFPVTVFEREVQELGASRPGLTWRTEALHSLVVCRFLEPLLDFALLEGRLEARPPGVNVWMWRRGTLFGQVLRFELEEESGTQR